MFCGDSVILWLNTVPKTQTTPAVLQPFILLGLWSELCKFQMKDVHCCSEGFTRFLSQAACGSPNSGLTGGGSTSLCVGDLSCEILIRSRGQP